MGRNNRKMHWYTYMFRFAPSIFR